MSRKKLNTTTEKNILVNSGRRCSLCYGLNGDSSIKSGQIAHIDKNSSNDSEGNLVFLCFDHHNEYDSINSQAKGITKKELVHYRDKLYDDILAGVVQNSQENHELSQDEKMMRNVYELLGDSNAMYWLHNLNITSFDNNDALNYIEGFIHNCNYIPEFSFDDATLEEYKRNIYCGLDNFIGVHAIAVQYDVESKRYYMPNNLKDRYEICQEIESARSIAVENYFKLYNRARKLKLI